MKQRYSPEVISADADMPQLSAATDPSAGESGAAPVKPLFELVELKDQGPNLPVGIVVNGKRVRPFRARPFRLKEEKELSKLKNEAKGMTIGKFVAEVISRMYATIGPHNLDSMKPAERLLTVCQLTMADVLYLYLYLRYEALGHDEPVVMKITCPACRVDYKWYGELGTMQVRVVPDDSLDLKRQCSLRDGIEIKGQPRKVVTLQPILWSAFLNKSFNGPQHESDAVRGAICGAEGVDQNPLVLTDKEMDELTKRDLNELVRDIDEHSPGPSLRIEPECPACQYKALMVLDWGWETFFSPSVRPTRTTS